MRYWFLGIFVIAVLPLSAQKKKYRLPPEIAEASGLFIAGSDSLWWHNDSDGKASLFLTNAKGELLAEAAVPKALNSDWEDLTADSAGRLYIGDFGNNLNNRKDLRIYIFDPLMMQTDSILFAYPDQTEFPPPAARAAFDMEAFFWWNDSLHLFSKNRLIKGNYVTRHYALPATPGRHIARLVDSTLLPKRVVTAAAIRSDGEQVALLSYFYTFVMGFIPKTRTSVFLFHNYPGSLFLQGTRQEIKIRKCPWPTQYEALDFLDAKSILIASERVPLRRAFMKRVKISAANKP